MLPRRSDEEGHPGDSSSATMNISSGASEDVAGNMNAEVDHGWNLWQLYVERAEKYDKDLVETWRDDMDSLLIFAALFSSCISAFVVESYQSLQQDSGDVTVSILLQISQQLANGTGSRPAAVIPTFKPDSQSVTINIFWFLSLAFSLICSLAAVMVRQWARKYLVVSRTQSDPRYRASGRHRSFQRMLSWKMDTIVEMIPALLHISLALFFAGLVLFLRLVNAEVQWCIIGFISVAASIYVLLTIFPIIFLYCPYKTPFTTLAPLFLWLWKIAVLMVALTTKCVVRLAEHGSMIFRKAAMAAMSSPIKLTPMPWPAKVHEFVKAVILVTIPHRLLPRGLQEQAQSTYTIRHYDLVWNIVHFYHIRERFPSAVTSQLEAFQWITRIASAESEKILIVKGIPDLVRSVGEFQSDADVLLRAELYLATSVTRRSVWTVLDLLRSCLTSGTVKKTRITLASSCIEALHWITRCPTTIGDVCPSDPTMRGFDEVCSPYHVPDGFSWTHMNQYALGALGCSESPVSLPFRCTISAVILELIFRAEWSLTLENDQPSVRTLQDIASTLAYVCQIHEGLILMFDEATRPSIIHIVPVLRNHFRDRIMDHSVEQIIQDLRSVRIIFASWMLHEFHSSISHQTESGSLVLRTLCDAATHLPDYPESTLSQQLTIFRLLNDGLRLPRQLYSTGVHTSVLNKLQNAIVGRVSEGKYPFTVNDRQTLHGSLFRSIKVVGYCGHYFDPSNFDIQVDFDEYCSIMHRLAAALRENLHDDDVVNDDPYGEAIIEFLQCRQRPGDVPADGGEFVNIDMDIHIATLLELRARTKLIALICLISDTASKFGYGQQLFEASSTEEMECMPCYSKMSCLPDEIETCYRDARYLH